MVYAAAEFEEFEEFADPILKLASDLRLHRRVEVLSLDELRSNWLPAGRCPKPVVAVIRMSSTR